MKLSPKSEALAFRIWAYAEPKGWDVLLADVASDLNVSIAQVRWVVTAKRWNSRFRGLKSPDSEIRPGRLHSFDAYDGGSYREVYTALVGYENDRGAM
jgi:hypothetical protein